MSLFCTGWTYIWLLILPFGLFPEAGWFELFPVAIMATMMLGLEDLTIQLEDPFKYIPYGEWVTAVGFRSHWELCLVAVMATMMLGLEHLTFQLEDLFRYIPDGERDQQSLQRN